MKWPSVIRLKGSQCLHIETHNCIINIRSNLVDRLDRNITHIEIIPDNYTGEPKTKVVGSKSIRIITLKKKN